MSVTVLSGEKLDSTTSQGLSEALNAVPGVATTQLYLGGSTNIEVRGVGASFPLYTGTSTVAYYLDSMPFGLVKSAIGPDADVYDLQRVEVLRGPQGTLYGASALNGVVRVLTNDADLSNFDYKARISDSGTDSGGDNYRADGMINIPIVPDVLAVRAVADYQHDSGWIDQPDKPDANDTNIQTYRVKVDAQPTPQLSVELSAWLSRTDSGAPNLGYTWDKSHTLADEPTLTNYNVFGAKIAYQLPDFTITSQTSYLQYYNAGTLGLDIPSPDFGIPGSLYFNSLGSNVVSEELNLNSSNDGEWRWNVGGIYRRGSESQYASFTNFFGIPPSASFDLSESYAFYGQLTRLLLNDRLELTGGLRYFHDDLSQLGQLVVGAGFLPASTTASAVTPRAVVTWHQNDNLMFYASYSEGFRSGFPQVPSVAVAGFPAARPDKLYNYELGSKGNLNDFISFDASVYHIDWKQIQLQLTVPINSLPYPGVVNGAEASGNGVDFSLAIRPADGFTISPYVSWNSLELDSDVLSGGALLYHKGDRPNSSPEVTAGISSAYSFDIGDGKTATLSASASYISPQAYRSLSGTTLLVQDSNAMFVTHASASIALSEHWTFTVYGDNLNNEHGATSIMFPGVVPDWQARIRPLTAGIQIEYRH